MEVSELESLKADMADLRRRIRKQERFENWFKVLTALGAVVAFGAGFWQYISTNSSEFRKAIWKEQYALYQEATASAAAVAIANKIDDVQGERAKFWELYWGKLSILEHPEVKQAMIDYGGQLREVEAGKAPPKTLEQLSYRLARACRESLRKTWNPADLGDLPTAP
jgi:hypothetical protein